MFELLVESGEQGRAGIGPRMTSLVVHGGLVALAAAGVSRGGPSAITRPMEEPFPIYIESGGRVPSRQGGSASVPGHIIGPPPAVPVDPPSAIPAVGAPVTAPRAGPSPQDLAGRELLGGGRSPAPVDPAQVLLAGEVDEPVRVLVPARLVYPARLAAAGVSGEVQLEFVVDTLGRCEPSTVRVLASSDPGFEPSAKEAVCGATYRPGQVRGAAVRQLVRQKVAFRQQ